MIASVVCCVVSRFGTMANDTDVETSESSDLWFDDVSKWNDLAYWKTVDGQEGFDGGIPCRDLEGWLDFEPQTEEEVELMSIERLFMISFVNSTNGAKLDLASWSYRKKKSRKEFKSDNTNMKTYFRLHLVINLLSKSQEMFYLIEKTSDQDLLWGENNRVYQRNCVYGCNFILAASQNTATYMSNGMIVIEPLYSIRQMVEIRYPTIPWKLKTGSMPFSFILNNTRVSLTSFNLVKSLCNGVYCDRRQKSNEGKHCACYVTGTQRGTPAITLRVSLRVQMNDKHTETIEWTSYELLKWMLKGNVTNDIRVDDMPLSRKMRSSLIKMFSYINNHGGFTVVGWAVQGEQADRSNPGEETVHSDHVTCHIAKLRPSDTSDEFDQVLKALRFDFA